MARESEDCDHTIVYPGAICAVHGDPFNVSQRMHICQDPKLLDYITLRRSPCLHLFPSPHPKVLWYVMISRRVHSRQHATSLKPVNRALPKAKPDGQHPLSISILKFPYLPPHLESPSHNAALPSSPSSNTQSLDLRGPCLFNRRHNPNRRQTQHQTLLDQTSRRSRRHLRLTHHHNTLQDSPTRRSRLFLCRRANTRCRPNDPRHPAPGPRVPISR